MSFRMHARNLDEQYYPSYPTNNYSSNKAVFNTPINFPSSSNKTTSSVNTMNSINSVDSSSVVPIRSYFNSYSNPSYIYENIHDVKAFHVIYSGTGRLRLLIGDTILHASDLGEVLETPVTTLDETEETKETEDTKETENTEEPETTKINHNSDVNCHVIDNFNRSFDGNSIIKVSINENDDLSVFIIKVEYN